VGALDRLREAVDALRATLHDTRPGDPAPSPRPTAAQMALTAADQWLLERATKDAESKFTKLWRGLWRELGYKERAHAEMALMCKLAWTTKGDPDQMDRLFRASALLSERFHAQGAEMIARAIEFARERTPERFDDD
jgi:hypothetical protein